jgi:hypothetical protein
LIFLIPNLLQFNSGGSSSERFAFIEERRKTIADITASNWLVSLAVYCPVGMARGNGWLCKVHSQRMRRIVRISADDLSPSAASATIRREFSYQSPSLRFPQFFQ